MKKGLEISWIEEASYRSVSWKNHKKEIIDSGFIIENSFISKNNAYYKCIAMCLSK